MKISRHRVLSAAASFAGIGIVRAPARAAQFQYKFGHDSALDHPHNVRAVQMVNDIKRETNGRLEISIYPNSMLGTDPAMIEQVRVGALQFSSQAGVILGAVIPGAGIESMPFVWKSSEQIYAALDADLGTTIRTEGAAKAGLHVFPHVLGGDMRVITSGTHPIRNADDLTGFKIRVPQGKLFVDVFRTLGSNVSTLSLNEVYTALQTHLVDGEENPYAIVETQRLYEVQTYLSVTNHLWTGQWFYANGAAFAALPPDIQAVVEKHARIYAERDRRDMAVLATSLADKLRRQGLIFNVADTASMKRRLGSYYAGAKADFGDAQWRVLERYVGKLG